MANPNITAITNAVAAVLAETQLGTTTTDFPVAVGKAWKVESGSVCNTSGSPVTVTISVLSASGGTARRIVSAYSLAAGDSLDLGPYLPKLLPEGAVLRAVASAATAVDLLVTGTVLG